MKMKKLIPAIAMLLVSAVLLGSSTYAWFSMNTTVSATGMEINVVSNNTFLLINDSVSGATDAAKAASIQTAGLTTKAIAVASPDVYPSSPILDAYVSDDATTNAATHKYFAAGTDVVEDDTTAAVEANWFTAQNNDPADSNNSVKNVNTLTAGNFANYVIKKTVYLTIAAGSDPANTLTVTPTIALRTSPAQTADDITGVKVLVVTDDGGFAILDSSMSTPQDIKGNDTNLTSTTIRTVDIYIYYDGEEDSVYTNNIADLAAATIDLQFDVAVA